MPDTPPKVFIGSSSESLPIVNTIRAALSDIASVTTWADPDVFPPTRFFLESLLDTGGKYDFGLFIFGPDDIVDSRGVSKPAPRDNVLFELGLFMRELGRERAIAIAPRGKVRVLSDLAGMKLVEYDEGATGLDLTGVGAQVRHQLGPILGELGCFPREDIRLGPEDAMAAGEALDAILADLPEDSIRTVDHLGLDLEVAWSYIATRVPKDANLRWRTLMIDPDSPEIIPLASDSVSVDIARLRVKGIPAFFRNKPTLSERFACRKYTPAPRMHGYLINRSTLLWSMCGISDGKLLGLGNGYWRFDAKRPDSYASQLLTSFSSWFDYLWDNASKPVWPETAAAGKA